MAVDGDGFSQEPGNLAVGHLAGLRWFQVDVSAHTERYAVPYPLDLLDEAPPWEASFRVEERQVQVPTLAGNRGEWVPGENVAACLGITTDSHPVLSSPVCGCGFWAYWALGDKRVSDPAIVGLIKGYGDYIRGDLGFRCSHAKIEALFIPGGHAVAGTANAIEARYQVPVYSSMEAMLLEHPAPEGQPPLRDDYYAAGRNVKPPKDLAGTLRHGAVRCQTCGRPACTACQPQCAACQTYTLAQQAQRQPKGTFSPSAPLTGTEATKALHQRRESWAGISASTLTYDETMKLSDAELAAMHTAMMVIPRQSGKLLPDKDDG
jgi:hypothetical protein